MFFSGLLEEVIFFVLLDNEKIKMLENMLKERDEMIVRM